MCFEKREPRLIVIKKRGREREERIGAKYDTRKNKVVFGNFGARFAAGLRGRRRRMIHAKILLGVVLFSGDKSAKECGQF